MAGVALISVHYYPDYVRASCSAAIRLAKRADARRLVFVANGSRVLADITRYVAGQRLSNATVLHHDNSGAEFGAFQVGLDSLSQDPPAWVIFANDTHSVHQLFSLVYKRHLLNCIRRSATQRACAVGQIEMLPAPYRLLGRSSKKWLTTNLFALSAPALRILENRLYHPRLDNLVTASARHNEFFSAEVDPVLVDHLKRWLFGEPGGNAWYAAEPLNASNAARLALKARSILQEKFMSASLVSGGAELVEIRNCDAFEKLVVRLEKKFHKTQRPTGSP